MLNKNVVVNRDQITQHLAALDYKQGDAVYLRSFYPSDDPRKDNDKGRSTEVRNLKQLIRTANAWQSDGRGVYFVVNGGGHSDKDVTNCRTIFYEHDNLHKDLQKDLWRSLNLPEPSLQIDTGGKSIHSYWNLDQFITPEEWKQLQTDLLDYADADRALKNPSRVMRLAGCWHFGPNNIPNGQTSIILNTSKRYSYSELRTIIPSPKPATSIIQLKMPSGKVPLYQCLTKDDRALIDGGAGTGERNNKGAKLARNLIGTSTRLTYLGHHDDDNPRTLFDDYCSRCSPPLDAREADGIWKSAEKSNPTAALTDEALENCIKSWQRQQSAYSQQPRANESKNQSVTGDSTKNGDSPNPLLLDVPTTVTTVTEILQTGLTDYEETQKLEEILSTSIVTKTAFKQLVSSVKSQIDDVQPEDGIRLDILINWHNAKLDFDHALPSMSADLKHDAAILNIEPIVIWQPLLAAVMSLAGKRVKLNVESHNIPAIAWTATVLESGGGKSRADNLVLTPLKRKQIEARKQFEEEMLGYQDWKEGDTDEPPIRPVERKYTFEVATIQAVIKRLSEQKENGVLWARDELAGLFKSFGQFGKGGENEGLECLLKLWDGSPAQVDRVSQGDGFIVEETALSLTGGIQPGVFRKIFQDPEDSQGMLARFLVANPQALIPKRVKGCCHLSEKLPHLYDWLENCHTGTIKLSSAADTYYTKLCEIIGRQAWETSQPAIRAWMFKLPTQLLRIALSLHLIECYHDSNRDYWHLQKDTLDRAVLFAQYYRSSFNVLQETTTQSDDISSILLKIWDAAITKHQDGISIRDAYRGIKSIQTRAKQSFRDVCAYTTELFGRLEQMGKGTVVKLGRQIKFVATLSPNNPPPPETGGAGELNSNSFSKGCTSVPEIFSPNSCNSLNDGDSVTIAKIHEQQGIELSPVDRLSPVTVPEHGNYLSSDNVAIGPGSKEEEVRRKKDEFERGFRPLLPIGRHKLEDHPSSLFPLTSDLVQTTHDTVTGVTPVVTETAIEPVANHQTDNSQEKSVVTEAVSTVQYLGATTPEITKGARVRVNFPGSKRHEKVGVVARFVYESGVKKAVVILENIEASLKHFLCPLPGTDLMRLEAI